MTSPDPNLTLWYAALTSPRGVKVRTTARATTLQKLYQARAAAKDPDLDGLSLVPSPADPNEIWIVKRNPDAQSE